MFNSQGLSGLSRCFEVSYVEGGPSFEPSVIAGLAGLYSVSLVVI